MLLFFEYLLFQFRAVLSGKRFFCSRFSERIEDSWMKKELDCSGEYQSSEDNSCKWEEEFFSHGRSRNNEWEEGERCSDGCHHNRYNSFE